MIAKLADWATVITAPLTILSAVAAWSGRLDRLARRSPRDSITPELVAALLVTLVWCFFFAAQLRIFVKLRRSLSDVGAFYASYLVGLIGLVMSSVVEALIVDALVPESSSPLVMLGWMALPFIAWVGATWFAISIVGSGVYEKGAA